MIVILDRKELRVTQQLLRLIISTYWWHKRPSNVYPSTFFGDIHNVTENNWHPKNIKGFWSNALIIDRSVWYCSWHPKSQLYIARKKLSATKTEENKCRHPAWSPDFTPTDYYVFYGLEKGSNLEATWKKCLFEEQYILFDAKKYINVRETTWLCRSTTLR